MTRKQAKELLARGVITKVSEDVYVISSSGKTFRFRRDLPKIPCEPESK